MKHIESQPVGGIVSTYANHVSATHSQGDVRFKFGETVESSWIDDVCESNTVEIRVAVTMTREVAGKLRDLLNRILAIDGPQNVSALHGEEK